MKLVNKYIAFFVILLCIVSCSENVIDNGIDDEETVANITCTIPEPIVDSEGMDTRGTISLGGTTITTGWETGEIITVYSTEGNMGLFTLYQESNDGKTGKFYGGGFGLKANTTYYSINKSTSSYGDDHDKYNIPWIKKSFTAFNPDNSSNIKMSYDGQRQTVNGNPDAVGNSENYIHAVDSLSKYDYMTADAIAAAENQCNFEFKRLGCILRIKISGLPADVKFQQLTMYDASEDMFREMARTTNITNTSSNTDYSPYYNDVTLSEDSKRFSIMLGKNVSGVEQGLSVSSTTEALFVYMMIPPIDLTGRTIAFRLTPVAGQTDGDGKAIKPYYCTYVRSAAFVAGKIATLSMTVQQCTQYSINVQVMHDWAKGNTVEQTRATGDPGKTDETTLPTYLYAFFVNDGKLVQMATANPASTDWTTSNGISTLSSSTIAWNIVGEKESYGTKLTLDNDYATNPRVYIVASPTAITEWKDASGNVVSDGTNDHKFAYGTTNGTEESVIQSLTYAYDADHIAAIYTTPATAALYNSSNLAETADASFVGALGDDAKDVRLYHVASKVDINWENNTSTALSGSVSLNNIPTTNLSFFKPTTNAAGSTVVSGSSITAGTAYNGRAVFYVPQPSDATYNVTIGSKTQDITFTPDATYTSWFRGLVTIK